MNPAYLWIGFAILTGAAGTFCQTFGAAESKDEPERKARLRQKLLAVGPLLTAFAVYCLWQGQELLGQQAAARPVVDAFIDANKSIVIRNVGTVDLQDITVEATAYVLRITTIDNGAHVALEGIESFSKLSRPIHAAERLAKGGDETRLDLLSSQIAPLLPIYEGVPDFSLARARTLYCFRIAFRNAVTKERLLRYVSTGAHKGFPDMLGSDRWVAMGGGYEASQKIIEVRRLIRVHQAGLFDDEPTLQQ